MALGPTGLALLVALCAARGAWADDRWETTSVPGGGDDDSTTANELVPGARQLHDIQGSATPGPVTDEDWMYVQTRAGHSYEVRTSGSNLRFRASFCKRCTSVDRVDVAGNILTVGFSFDDGPIGFGQHVVVRWIGTADQRDWIRVQGDRELDMTANDQYEIELLDTTYYVPRWNQSGTQSTVLLIQNTTTSTPFVGVYGSVLFYDAGGTLLHTEPLGVNLNGVTILQLGSVPALAGRSGSAVIVHTGGYGALAGKAVALEPATGFTFDTPIVAHQR